MGKKRREAEWAEAKRRCRLNAETLQMAKELGLNPRSLTRNIPSKSQPWKAPVAVWIRELYRKREDAVTRRRAQRGARPAGNEPSPGSPRARSDGSALAPPEGTRERRGEENLEGNMSARKRRPRESARSFTPGDVSRPDLEGRSLSAREVNVQREVGHITECAARGEGRIVTLGVLVFFSTPEGDAWMLDAEDGLASCLMQDGERRDTPIRTETGQGFSVAWESAFAIEGGCFFTRSAEGKLTAWPGYPAEDIRRAIRRAGSPPG